jgi:hypothetical protein
MEIISFVQHDLEEEVGIKTNCKVYSIHCKIDDLPKETKEIINILIDTSWSSKLVPADYISYNARAKITIDKIVNDIIKKVDSKVTPEFGEYLISLSAGKALEINNEHKRLPIAELWKEKKSGNPAFDFHTECPNERLFFGEAKFNSTSNPYKDAIDQIQDFIKDAKDDKELSDLKNFVSSSTIENYINKKKGYIAAFSLNTDNSTLIFKNIIKGDYLIEILDYDELFLIGIQV